jgi:peroxiredoxin
MPVGQRLKRPARQARTNGYQSIEDDWSMTGLPYPRRIPMRADIVPGSSFPDYELRDHRGQPRRLSALQGDNPMILVLSRGHFCPKDRMQLTELVDFCKRLDVGYARLVTITTDTLLEVNELRSGVGAHWPFLHDPERIVQKDLDIVEYTDTMHDPMIPHTFVLKPALVIHKIYNGYWFWGRPTVHELHVDLREATEEIRPDWKIDTSEMRERWDAGERESFWPYGRSLAQIFSEEG